MEQQFKCQNCNGDHYKIVNEQTKIQKELRAGYLILLIVFTLIAIIGIGMIIINALNIKFTVNEISYSNKMEEIDKNIIKYFQNTLEIEAFKANIFVGASLIILGFIGVIFTAIFYNIDPTYVVKNEAKKLCLTCGKKWKLKKIESQDPDQNNS